MIVVFDSCLSERAHVLRYGILSNRFPCAVCDPGTIGNLLPIDIIVTFTDQIDVVRRMPYDEIPVIAYGDGFVNSALNAVRAGTMTEVFKKLKYYISRKFALNGEKSFFGIGAFFYPGVFLSQFQLIVYGSRFDLTENEISIMRCLILSGDCYRSAKQLAAYSCKRNPNENSVRVHICSINKKAEARLPAPLVDSKHGYGYRFGYIDDHTPK